MINDKINGTLTVLWRIATFAGFGITAGVLGVMLADRRPPVEVYDVQVMNQDARVQLGTDLIVKYDVYRNAACRSIIQSVFRDRLGTRFVLDDIMLFMSPAIIGRDSYAMRVNVPVKMVEGEAIFRHVFVYYCNPLHYLWPVIAPSPDIHFTVFGPPVVPAQQGTPKVQ